MVRNIFGIMYQCLPEKKVPGLNYHVTFPSRDLENPAIFQYASMSFHVSNYLEIKTISPELVKEFPC